MTDALTNEQMTAMYRKMLVIRRFEERCNTLFMQGRIPSTLHLYIGQEAVAVGVCEHLSHNDYVLGTHRPHGHAIAKGVSLRDIMAELMAKVTGCSKGKAGSMHVGDMRVGMPPAIAIVGANAPIACGMALAQKRQGTNNVTACFFGDGAVNEGAVHEAMNMAAIWSLPVVFVCENNLYGASTPFHAISKLPDIADRAAAYGMPGMIADGSDVLDVYAVSAQAIARARNGEGPTMVECKTYRLCGHSRSDPLTYRSKEEEAHWREREPIQRLAGQLVERGVLLTSELEAIERSVMDEVDDAVAFADASPYPLPEDALKHVFFS